MLHMRKIVQGRDKTQAHCLKKLMESELLHI